MTSLRSFSKLHCVGCDDVTLHDFFGCIHRDKHPDIVSHPYLAPVRFQSFDGATEEETRKHRKSAGGHGFPTPSPKVLRRRARVLELYQAGNDRHAIARELDMDPMEVSSDLNRLKQKSGLSNVAELRTRARGWL